MVKPLTVLIADDNFTDRMILSAITRREGHIVLEAENGEEAVKCYVSARPDLVLMDALMPVMDGMDAAREIRRIAGEELVPIIFLTSLQDAKSLAECLDAGGDDFLSKPYSRVILQAKIKAFSRMRAMHDALQSNHRQLLLEQSVAKKVYDNVTQSGQMQIHNLRHSLSSKAMFNGDTVLAQYRPDGGLHVFVGDFTGHGLPAAIGAMPLAETFYGMTSKGFELEEIVREMNAKLMRVLPVNFFCCGAALHMDLREKTARLWVGGVPDCYLYRSSGDVEALKSRNLPLGITENQYFTVKLHDLSMQNGDRLFLWSDGIIEAEDVSGTMFGEWRLRQVFTDVKAPEHLFDRLLSSVAEFLDDRGHSDDTTLVEVVMTDPKLPDPQDLEAWQQSQQLALDWTVSFEFPTATLKNHNPMPLVMHVLSETEGLSAYSSQLYTVISELYSNALEHGVLRLDSALKRSGQGFGDYYAQRQRRLDALTDGCIWLSIKQSAQGAGGVVTIRMEDSGPGFDHEAVKTDAVATSALSGRGMKLVRQLATRVDYLGCGNTVEVDFQWPVGRRV